MKLTSATTNVRPGDRRQNANRHTIAVSVMSRPAIHCRKFWFRVGLAIEMNIALSDSSLNGRVAAS